MRLPAALLGFIALGAWAQTCLVCGEVRSIREVNESVVEPKAPTTVGTSSGLDTDPVVGTVAQFRFDRGRDDGRLCDRAFLVRRQHGIQCSCRVGQRVSWRCRPGTLKPWSKKPTTARSSRSPAT